MIRKAFLTWYNWFWKVRSVYSTLLTQEVFFVQVLVAMGAEIFMRDRRGRTAKDTATRRSHFRLLVWLDTQVMIMIH